MTSPSILFLDEPTSGLDAYNAYNVVESLVTLARDYNRTVIFTIHQPRSNIVALFDQLVVLAKGEAVYSGPFAECQSYFEKIGFGCPPGFNIADYLSMFCCFCSGFFYSRLTVVDLTMHASGEAPQASPEADEAVNPIVGSSAQSRTDEEQGLALPREPPVASSSSSERGDGLEPRKRRRSFLSQIKETLGDLTGSSTKVDPRHPIKEVNLETLVKVYRESEIAERVRQDIDSAASAHDLPLDGSTNESNTPVNDAQSGQQRDVAEESKVLRGRRRANWITQFRILSGRAFKNLYRNPALLTAHYTAAVAIAGQFYSIIDEYHLLTKPFQLSVACLSTKYRTISQGSRIVLDFSFLPSLYSGSLVSRAWAYSPTNGSYSCENGTPQLSEDIHQFLIQQ